MVIIATDTTPMEQTNPKMSKSSKPRIFISIHYLEIGGAETSLIGLLQALDPERVEVDLFVHDHRGEMMPFIPQWVNLLPEIPKYAGIERPMIEVLKKGHIQLLLARLIARWQFQQYVRKNHPKDGSSLFGYIGKYVTPILPSLHRYGTYDLAISFLTPHNIVLEKVQAKKRICWIHTDYTNIDVNATLELPVWAGYDYIASISEEAGKGFCQVFPSLQSKLIEIENILSPAFIRKRAQEGGLPQDMPTSPQEITLLTIGRYCYAKKMEEIPILCRLLQEKGLSVKWYIIGFGSSDADIRQAIQQEGMQEHVILLGKRTNPYPYIAACDWYIQPSRYEGKSVVVREAQILQKPVIITAYPTAASQVTNGMDGVIVPLPVEACAEAMAKAIQDTKLQAQIIEHLRTHDYGNEKEVEKIYSIL